MSYQIAAEIHEFYCTQCGKCGIPVPRKLGYLRECGHLKMLYCIFCGKVTNHAEGISGSAYSVRNFMEEFQSGNFDEEGKRKLNLTQWKKEKNKKNRQKSKTDSLKAEDEDLEDWYIFFDIAEDNVQEENLTERQSASYSEQV